MNKDWREIKVDEKTGRIDKILSRIKVGSLVSWKHGGVSYGIVRDISSSYIYVDEIMFEHPYIFGRLYHIDNFMGNFEHKAVPIHKVRIPTNASLKRFFKGWEEYVRWTKRYLAGTFEAEKNIRKAEEELEKAKRMVRKLGYKV